MGDTRSIRGEDLFFFFLENTLILGVTKTFFLKNTLNLGEESERRDQSSFSFFGEHQFLKILTSGP